MKIILGFILTVIVLLAFPHKLYAIEDPVSLPNNRFGIHILFPSELEEAAKLVNSNGGDWGYVTIPIQAHDKDLDKWQQFMDDAKKYHVIPIVRLATQGDYFNTKVWRKPDLEDILDFSNFLNSLNWPVKNKYIIVFNEVNRADEWGGEVDPAEYAEILNYAATIFKSTDQNFFVISAGLDNAAPQKPPEYMNEYEFFKQMNDAVPGIFYQADGIASHSYPNPAFSQPPEKQDKESIASYRFEKQFLQQFANKDLPVFITETGWSNERISESAAAIYYQTLFNSLWQDKDIVAITPFLLRAGAGPFQVFSFIKQNGALSEQYKTIQSLPKIKGAPTQNKSVLGDQTPKNFPFAPPREFLPHQLLKTEIRVPGPMKQFFKKLLNME